jgi:hypothetical protein
LHYAARASSVENVRRLIACGADTQVMSESNVTPVQLATEAGRVALLSIMNGTLPYQHYSRLNRTNRLTITFAEAQTVDWVLQRKLTQLREMDAEIIALGMRIDDLKTMEAKESKRAEEQKDALGKLEEKVARQKHGMYYERERESACVSEM